MGFMPYGRQAIDDHDIAQVVACLKSDWLTSGPMVEAFEKLFAEKVGAKYAVSCSSGTAALHLAMLSIPTSVIGNAIVPAITFLATANCALYTNREVIFADVDPYSALLTPYTLLEAIHRGKTAQVVLPVHMAGQVVDLGEISRITREKGIFIIEDACHALGSKYVVDGKTYTVGSCSHSDMTVFSTHPVKTIATGEGGVVTTNDEIIYKNLMKYRNHGMVREHTSMQNHSMSYDKNGEMNPWYYEQQVLGYNYRLDAMSCALGTSQLKKLDTFVLKRQTLVKEYDRLLHNNPVIRPVNKRDLQRTGWHLYIVRIPFNQIGITRKELMQALAEKKIGSQVHYIPVNEQPFFAKRYGSLTLNGANDYYQHCLSLPLYVDMEIEDVEFVVNSLSEIVSEQKNKNSFEKIFT